MGLDLMCVQRDQGFSLEAEARGISERGMLTASRKVLDCGKAIEGGKA